MSPPRVIAMTKEKKKSISSRPILPNTKPSSARISQNLEDAPMDISADSLMELRNSFCHLLLKPLRRKNVMGSGRTANVLTEFDANLFTTMSKSRLDHYF